MAAVIEAPDLLAGTMEPLLGRQFDPLFLVAWVQISAWIAKRYTSVSAQVS
jgi:hypothetical protein